MFINVMGFGLSKRWLGGLIALFMFQSGSVSAAPEPVSFDGTFNILLLADTPPEIFSMITGIDESHFEISRLLSDADKAKLDFCKSEITALSVILDGINETENPDTHQKLSDHIYQLRNTFAPLYSLDEASRKTPYRLTSTLSSPPNMIPIPNFNFEIRQDTSYVVANLRGNQTASLDGEQVRDIFVTLSEMAEQFDAFQPSVEQWEPVYNIMFDDVSGLARTKDDVRTQLNEYPSLTYADYG